MKSLGWKNSAQYFIIFLFYTRVPVSKTDTVDKAAIFKKVLNK